jgi:hypothetical protein
MSVERHDLDKMNLQLTKLYSRREARMLICARTVSALGCLLLSGPAFAELRPEVKRAVRLEACRIQAEKRVPDRLFDQAMTVRQRAAMIADCVTHTGSTPRETAAAER